MLFTDFYKLETDFYRTKRLLNFVFRKLLVRTMLIEITNFINSIIIVMQAALIELCVLKIVSKNYA